MPQSKLVGFQVIFLDIMKDYMQATEELAKVTSNHSRNIYLGVLVGVNAEVQQMKVATITMMHQIIQLNKLCTG